jgi:hypothetical protein
MELQEFFVSERELTPSVEQVTPHAFFESFLDVVSQGKADEIIFAVERVLTVIARQPPELAATLAVVITDQYLPCGSGPAEYGTRVIKEAHASPLDRAAIMLKTTAYAVTAPGSKLSSDAQLHGSVLAVNYAASQFWLDNPQRPSHEMLVVALKAYLGELDAYVHGAVERMVTSNTSDELADALAAAVVIGDLKTDISDNFDEKSGGALSSAS